MKKSVVFGILFLMFILSGTTFVLAALENETAAVENAYQCLTNKVENKTCVSITLTEQIFSLLTIGECQNETELAAQGNNECWPKGSCDLKTTALATLALEGIGENTTEAEDWMLSKKGVADNLQWFLEIDTKKESLCTISYSGGQDNIRVNADKTVQILTQPACQISVTNSGYWIEIRGPCYEEEFEISCDEDFLTTLLFKKPTEPTIYVTGDVHSSDATGSTAEKIKSSCFTGFGGACNYEGTLWSTIVLDYLGEDISDFIPYLIVGANDFPQYIPSSFLYSLTDKLEFKTDLTSMQINKQYWKRGGDKFYDTATALLPFQNDEIPEKTFAKEWLLDNNVQGKDGCWDNANIKSTAYILYSIWPRAVSKKNGVSILDDDCGDVNGFCMSGISCANSGGNLLLGYDCPTRQKCCDTAKKQTTCAGDFNGDVCSSNEVCGGAERTTDDLKYGETCCVGGTCSTPIIPPKEDNECEKNLGSCESSCISGEKETTDSCDSSSKVCCVEDDKPEIGYWWVWVLFGLIVLTILAIMFKEKIKEFFEKGQAKKQGPRPGLPPSYQRRPMNRPPMQRKILPPQQRPTRAPVQRPTMRRPGQKSPKELDEVLAKLKRMSKS